MSYRELHRFLVHWKDIWCCKTVKWGHAAEAALGDGCVLISLFNWKKRNEGKNDGSPQMNKLEFILWAWSSLPTCVVSFYLSWKKIFTILGAICTADEFKKSGERCTTNRGCKTSWGNGVFSSAKYVQMQQPSAVCAHCCLNPSGPTPLGHTAGAARPRGPRSTLLKTQMSKQKG